MTDIAQFLAARLAEDENCARLVLSDYGGHVPNWQVPSTGVLVVGEDLHPLGDGPLVEHIARHDPARVLAEVAAKRAIVAMHEQAEKLVWDPRPAGTPVREPRREPAGYCSTCQVEDGVIHGTWPCDTLKHLATVYSEHPDFNPAWGIDG